MKYVAKVISANESTSTLRLRKWDREGAPACEQEKKGQENHLQPDFCLPVLSLTGMDTALFHKLAIGMEQTTINAESFYAFTFNFLEPLGILGFLIVFMLLLKYHLYNDFPDQSI